MENFRNFFKRFNSAGKSIRFGESPEADWKIIFTSAGILVLVITLINVYALIRTSRVSEASLEEEAGTATTFNIERLKDTVFYYQNKAKEFEKIKNDTTTGIVDPSL